MIRQAVPTADIELQQRIQDSMLDFYEQNIAEYSRCYQGMAEVLQTIEQLGLKWGVVTNKKQRFTQPLLAALQLSERAACAISGDSTPYSKPHPEPLFAACRQAGLNPAQCVYIGDAAHDISAGKQANMRTLAAAYGYVGEGCQVESWGADGIITHPLQLQNWIQAHL